MATLQWIFALPLPFLPFMTIFSFSLFQIYWKFSQIEKMQGLMQKNHLCYFSYASCLASHQLPLFYKWW
jgi:hypothetical protein